MSKKKTFLQKGLASLHNPWIWWAWFKGLVMGFLIGWLLF